MKAKKTYRQALGLLLLLGLAGASAFAGTVNYAADVNTPADPVYSIATFVTSGFSMGAGLDVTVYFSNGTHQAEVWAAGANTSCGTNAGTGSGSATGTNWSLSECGDTGTTYSGLGGNPPAWTLSNSSTTLGIVEVVLSGTSLANGTNVLLGRNQVSCTGATPATCVSAGGQAGTPGDGGGITFQEAVGYTEAGLNTPYSVTAQYSNPVILGNGQTGCTGSNFAGNSSNALPGCGDEFQTVTFTFNNTGTVNGFVAASAGTPALYEFYQDTDTSGVPEPMTFGLVGLGLLGMGAIARKRRAKRA